MSASWAAIAVMQGVQVQCRRAGRLSPSCKACRCSAGEPGGNRRHAERAGAMSASWAAIAVMQGVQ
eukprot:59686-Chlamydomonas_euryale.AAC.1